MKNASTKVKIALLLLMGSLLQMNVEAANKLSSFMYDGTAPIQQQLRIVSGKVVNNLQEPIIGATIKIKGIDGSGTITDADGNFTLEILPNAVLVVSYIGYKTQEFVTGNRKTFNVILDEDVEILDEVVVVGYGVAKKKDLSGAISTVSGDKLAERKNMSLSTSMQGVMPGLMVTRSNGSPGSEATLKVRGITTIGDSSPLIIVDGVIVDNIDFVNANDVENITVLKDAASASIYGSRAAAGVILVTTKRAKEKQFTIGYTVEYGFEKLATRPKYVNATRFMEMENELRWNDAGNGSNKYPTYDKDLISNYYTLHAENPNKYPITDWYDLVLDNTAPRQSHLINLSGGTQKIKSKVSIGYDQVNGLYAHKSSNRYTVRINNDFSINKYISAIANISARRSTNNDAIENPFQGGINNAPAIFAGLWSDGRYGAGREGANIHAIVNEGGFSKTIHNHISAKLGVDIKPLSGLTLSASFSPTFNFYKGKTFKKAIPYYDADDPSKLVGYMSGYDAKATSLNEIRNDSYELLAQFVGNYIKSFGDHNINVMVGYEGYKSFNESLSAGRSQYILDSFPYLDLGPLDYRTNSGTASEYAYRSWFGRVMYNYMNRYLLQANVRIDGSSRFHKDHRWGTFPSFSGGWVISEEPFYKKTAFLSYLKLRVSWGTLGNERIGDYPYQSTIRFTNIPFISGGKVVSQQAATPSKFPIKDISWETTESWNIGIDAYLFDNRLRVGFDYFYKTTKDMLLALEIPDYVGYEKNPDKNTGKMHTNGFELEVGWNDKIGDWRYSISANLSDFKSKMGDLGGTEFLGDQVKKKGSEFNEWYGYVAEGIYQTQEEVDNSPVLNATVKPGDIKYRDISGPDGIPDGKISPEYDRVLLGGSLPRFMYGSNFYVSYKDFDLSVTLQGVGKINSRKTADMVRPLRDNWANIPSLLDGKYWSHYNSDAQNMVAEYPRLTNTNAANNYAMSSFWLFNGAYLRMKNITLGYTVPKTFTNKIGISGLRFYAAVNDLFSISNFPNGWDPEMTNFAYPITTSFIFGASINF